MEIKELLQQYAQNGSVKAIILRPGRREDPQSVHSTRAVAGKGLEGDRYRSSGNRQVSLIQSEHLAAVASFLGKSSIDPALTRRNIVVDGLNLLTLKGKRFRVGGALLEYSGECHPCSRMEENLGTGGYNAMRGHGGILAKIVESGDINIGDPVVPIPNENNSIE
jgi:MOSC domain-containing protein YiiM